MATIIDVAKLAGVSVGTVSRVLAKNDTVKPKLQTKVDAAIKELRFKPNAAARALRKSQSDLMALIVPDIEDAIYSETIKSVELAASKNGLLLLLTSSQKQPAVQAKRLAALLDHSPLVVIIIPVSGDDLELPATEIPIFVIGDDMTDHRSNARLVAHHLLALGHRRIGYAVGPEKSPLARMHKKGFIGELERNSGKAGLNPVIEIHSAEETIGSGEELGRIFLNVPEDERPTAIVTTTDTMAFGIIRTARNLGIEIPGQLSIIGYGNSPEAELAAPALTSVGFSGSVIQSAILAIQAASEKGREPETKQHSGFLIRRQTDGPVPI